MCTNKRLSSTESQYGFVHVVHEQFETYRCAVAQKEKYISTT